MLSKTAEYALRAVVFLGRGAGAAESAERLAEVTKVPRRYLHKVLQDLIWGVPSWCVRNQRREAAIRSRARRRKLQSLMSSMQCRRSNAFGSARSD